MAARNAREIPLLTVGALARRLGCAESTIRRLADRGEIQSMRDANGRRLFTEEAAQLTARKRGGK